jgi:uncharacterized protein
MSWTSRILRDAAFVIIGLVIVLSFLNIRFPRPAPQGDAQAELRTMKLRVGERTLIVEVAETAEEHRKGLSFRSSLPQDRGMIFLFDAPQPQRFWMFGMQFPLDMVFVQNGVVVDYEEQVPTPGSTQNDPAVVTSLEDANMVLEINAGQAKELGIAIGTRIDLE